MKLTMWNYDVITIPMIEDGSGQLYCTSAALRGALLLSASKLRKIVERHGHELNPLSVSDCHAKGLTQFLSDNREIFGVQRMREDLLIWPLEEALDLAYIARTEVARKFIRAGIELIKQHATTTAISLEQYQAMEAHAQSLAQEIEILKAELGETKAEAGRTKIDLATNKADLAANAERLERLEDFILTSRTSLELAASAAGRSLQAQRGTKGIRSFDN